MANNCNAFQYVANKQKTSETSEISLHLSYWLRSLYIVTYY